MFQTPTKMKSFQNYSALNFPLYFISIVIFEFLMALPTSNCHTELYKQKACSSSWTCGSISNIGYPFWGLGRPQYCGHPALMLHCGSNSSNEQPILTLGHDSDHRVAYRVVAINKTNPVQTIKLQNELSEQPSCSLIFHIPLKEAVEAHIFAYSGGVERITLYYNCTSNLTDVHLNHSVTCQAYPGNGLTAYFQPDFMQNCRSLVDVAVLGSELGRVENRNETLMDLLKQGLEMNFDATDCHLCKESGGECGSSNFQFSCMCEDQSYSDVCRNPNSGEWKLILGLVVGGFFLFSINIGFCYWVKIKFCKPPLFKGTISTNTMSPDHETGISFHGIPVFSYTELQEATNNFDSTRELGDGGFGIVYHGKLRDGREVAVKRLFEKKYNRVGQFMNEVEILTRLRHPNLVTLYGCTSRNSRELLLVYEYIPNGTVADHLYGNRAGSRALTWGIRMKIAVETATALSYLHTSDIVHRDVKANNILLDNNFSVKVADFGLSRLFPIDMTHVSTAPQGTPGYLDPEYHRCYQVTAKSDVYSFGVLLVELISSLPAVDISRQEHEINLSDYALNRIHKGLLDELVDQHLGIHSNSKAKKSIALVAEVAFQCLQQEKEVRPCMDEVLNALIRIERLDYTASEAAEMTDETTSVPKSICVAFENGTKMRPPSSPSSVICNWAIKSSSTSNSNPSS